MPSMPDVIFSPVRISALSDSHKLSSSAGADEITSKLLKNVKYISAMNLNLLFSQPLLSGTLPDEWEKSKVVPVYKSGNCQSPLNYLPISITGALCKIMEHIIFSHVMNFLDSNNFFCLSQHGFIRVYVTPN